MLAFSLRREPDIYNSLSISAIFILGTNPQQLFDIGFQLSFVSVISIVYFYPKMKIIFRLGNLKVKCIKSILEGCLVSFSAWLGTFGLIAYYFKIFSPITVLANLFIVPLASLITLCGFSLVMIGLIFPFAAKFFASSSELAVAVLININMFLIKLPYACLRLP
jgi:competence protein ComEC